MEQPKQLRYLRIEQDTRAALLQEHAMAVRRSSDVLTLKGFILCMPAIFIHRFLQFPGIYIFLVLTVESNENVPGPDVCSPTSFVGFV